MYNEGSIMPIILILVGFILIIYSYLSMKREKALHNNNEQSEFASFQDILRDNKSGLTDYKFELGVLRKDIGESLNELQQEILDIKVTLNMIKEKDGIHENKSDIKDHNNLHEEYDNKSSKTSSIRVLLEEGLTDEEISRKLSVSKGEILLVKGLYKQQ